MSFKNQFWAFAVCEDLIELIELQISNFSWKFMFPNSGIISLAPWCPLEVDMWSHHPARMSGRLYKPLYSLSGSCISLWIRRVCKTPLPPHTLFKDKEPASLTDKDIWVSGRRSPGHSSPPVLSSVSPDPSHCLLLSNIMQILSS